MMFTKNLNTPKLASSAKSLLLGSCVFTLIATPAIAAPELEEIIITAQKTSESLQDVPISVSAITSKTLEDKRITNWTDMQIPGVNISDGPNSDILVIRGVGSGLNFGFEQSAPLYIDGVYFGRGRSQRLGFLDLERVEILKGPQPTFFGKNAIAGAFSMISKKPTDEFEALVDASYEFEAKEVIVFGAVSGPVADKVKMRAAVKYRDMKGFMNNVATGTTDGGSKDIVARLTTVIDPSDTMQITLKFEYGDSDQRGGVNQLVHCISGGQFDPAVEDCVFDRNRAVTYDINDFVSPVDELLLEGGDDNPDSDSRIIGYEQIGGSAAIDWDLDNVQLSSVTAYYEYTSQFFAKADWSTLPVLVAADGEGDAEQFNQFSQELRLRSNQDDNVRWMVGAYYDTSQYNTSTIAVLPVNAALGRPGLAVTPDVKESAHSWAAFAEILVTDEDEKLTLKFGGRYEEVNKSADMTFDFLLGFPGPSFVVPPLSFEQSGTIKNTKFTPSITAQWQPTEDVMLYASWKKGFKAGGFDHEVAVNDPVGLQFEPEKVTSYELGAKLVLADNSATLNIAAFRMEYSDLQTVQFDGVAAFRTSNAAEAISQGVEVELNWAATDNLTLSASAAFLDNSYSSYPGAQCFINPQQTVAQGCVDGSQDLGGTPLPFSPNFSGNFSANYHQPISEDLEFQSTLSLYYTDRFQTNTTGDALTFQEKFAKLDLRVGVGAEDGSWDIAFVGRNLTDKLTALFIGDQPGGGAASAKYAIAARPIQLSIQARTRF